MTAYHNHSWTPENYMQDGLRVVCLETHKKEGESSAKCRAESEGQNRWPLPFPPSPSPAERHPEGSWSQRQTPVGENPPMLHPWPGVRSELWDPCSTPASLGERTWGMAAAFGHPPAPKGWAAASWHHRGQIISFKQQEKRTKTTPFPPPFLSRNKGSTYFTLSKAWLFLTFLYFSLSLTLLLLFGFFLGFFDRDLVLFTPLWLNGFIIGPLVGKKQKTCQARRRVGKKKIFVRNILILNKLN